MTGGTVDGTALNWGAPLTAAILDMSPEQCKVFISYSRHDEDLVKPLARLLGVEGVSVFLDVDRIEPGDFWRREIEAAVQHSSVFILCWCCESQRSQFVAYEIGIALRNPKRRLVPVLFCSIPLPASLSDRQWVDLSGNVKHLCSHGGSSRRRGIRGMLRRLRNSQAAFASIVITAVLFVMFLVWRMSTPTMSSGSADLCYFASGPYAGREVWVEHNRVRDEGTCQDGHGNRGVLIRSGRQNEETQGFGRILISDGLIDIVMVLCVAALAGLIMFGVCIMIIGGVRQVTSWVQTEPAKLAAIARRYFEEFAAMPEDSR